MEKQISPNDQAVLNAIFNPFEPNSTCSQLNESNETCDSNQNPLPDELKAKEVEAIRLAEQGKLEESLSLLNELITQRPDCASALNNRAQVLQLLGRLDLAIQDLEQAIALCDQTSDKRSRQTLAQALCQRALLHRLNGKDEECRQDFGQAARLGSEFARKQLIQLNPYAALCNQMLGQMLNNVRQGKPEDN